MGKRSFGRIHQLPSGRHRARYSGPDTVVHSAPHTFDTKLDAEAWLTDERRLISAGTWTSPAARAEAKRQAEADRQSNLFDVYARSWLAGRHDLRPSTREDYASTLKRHLIPAFGELPVTEITTPLVRSWFNGYGDKTPTARAHAYQLLSSILGQAEEDGLIPRSPVRIKAGGRATAKREPEVLTLAELLALADVMPEKHRALTLLCGLGGLRFGEAVALRRKDIDLENGVVKVRHTLVRAKGTKTTGPTKTRAGIRDVTLPALVVDALRDHLKTVPITGGREGLVFPGKDGSLLAPSALYGSNPRIEKRGRKSYPKKGYGFYAARVKIDHPDLHWHDLRRTAATLGAQTGATVKEIQHRLGHTTPAMALHYQQATADRDRQIADRLQATIENSRP